ncbi:MAG: AAA family ATPase [Methermicoccaceae archaeon]
MLISQLELKNIKSYRHATIDFLDGVNGIIGDNGSGKSTILEAIGYALFNFLPYKKNDFLRKGAKSGRVMLRIVGDDGARYEIERVVGASGTYRLSCPTKQIDVSGKRDVLHVIATHVLGTIPEEQLSPMFEQLIGVPQGSFFSAFLLSNAQRKEQFNRILRIDEYDRAFENMRDVERRLENEIVRLEQHTTELKALTREYPSLKEQADVLKHKLADYVAELDEKRMLIEHTKKLLEELEHVVEELRRVREARNPLLVEEKEKKTRLKGVQEQLEKVNEARLKLERLKPMYAEHEQLKEDIKVLDAKERRRIELERLMEGYIARVSELANQLEGRERLKEEIKKLEMACKKLEGAKERYTALGALKDELIELSQSRDELKARIRELKESIDELTALADDVARDERELASLKVLSQREDSLTEQAAGKRAMLAQLEKEKKHLTEQMHTSGMGKECPILKGVECPVVESFESYFRERIKDVEHRIEQGREELLALEDEIMRLGEPKRRAAMLEGEIREKRRRLTMQQSIEQEMAEAMVQLKKVEATVAEASKRADMPLFAHDVKGLIEHVKEVMGGLERDVDELKQYERELSLNRKKLHELDEVYERMQELNQEMHEIELELRGLAGTSEELVLKKQRLDELEQPYREYIAAEQDASRHDELELLKTRLERELEALLMRDEQLEREYEMLVERYSDEEHLEAVETQKAAERLMLNLEKKVMQLKTQESEVKRRLKELDELLERLAHAQDELADVRARHELVEFIRDVLKRAAPLVISRIVRDVSEEANEIYCEAMGTYTQQLTWSDEEESLYDIQLKEGAEVRSFRQLSGGEQMCASIAIRLALLRLLSDSDVVFLDEPTANLDEQRRENLSDEVLNIKGFRQIFVITHDDSFSDKYDHTVHLKKVNGESVVVSPFD